MRTAGRRRSKIIGIQLIVVGVFVFSLLYFAVFHSNILAVRQVSVTVDDAACVQNVDFVDRYKLKRKTIFSSWEDLVKSIQNDFLCVDTVKINKEFNRDVNILVTTRKPEAVIFEVKSPIVKALDTLEATPSSSAAMLDFSFELSSQSAKFLIDKTGVIYSKLFGAVNLPELAVSEMEVEVGKKIPDDLLRISLAIIDGVKSNALEIKSLRLKNEYLYVDGTVKLIFNLRPPQAPNTYETQLATLQLILQKAKMDSKVIERVDLRYIKPVVVYFPQAKTTSF